MQIPGQEKCSKIYHSVYHKQKMNLKGGFYGAGLKKT
jgi:hypothetical protein